MYDGLPFNKNNNIFISVLQDVIKKKGSLLCPECRNPVTVEISSLPSNILLNRLLEVNT